MDSKNLFRSLLRDWLLLPPRSPSVGVWYPWMCSHFGLLLFIKSTLGKRFMDVGVLPHVVPPLRSPGEISCIKPCWSLTSRTNAAESSPRPAKPSARMNSTGTFGNTRATASFEAPHKQPSPMPSNKISLQPSPFTVCAYITKGHARSLLYTCLSALQYKL